MTLVEKLIAVIEAANQRQIEVDETTSLYSVTYEESKMMNVKVDELQKTASFAYIEEFVQGKYVNKFGQKKVMKMQIYFCKFTELQCNAIDKERLRSTIESEIVEPFMRQYNESGLFDKVEVFTIYYPFPRFDANEVSVMLEFDCSTRKC